jgi:hypothetical protein
MTGPALGGFPSMHENARFVDTTNIVHGICETLSVLYLNHGNELAQFWRAIFGHGIDCLTNLEAGYLSRVESVDAIRTRMAQAAELARRRGLSAIDV